MKRSSVSRTDPSSKMNSDFIITESEYYSVGRFEHVGCSEAQISFTLITTWHTRMDWFCEPVLFLSGHYNTPDPGSVWHSVCGDSRSDALYSSLHYVDKQHQTPQAERHSGDAFASCVGLFKADFNLQTSTTGRTLTPPPRNTWRNISQHL